MKGIQAEGRSLHVTTGSRCGHWPGLEQEGNRLYEGALPEKKKRKNSGPSRSWNTLSFERKFAFLAESLKDGLVMTS